MPKEGKGPAGAGPGQGWLRGHRGARVVRPQADTPSHSRGQRSTGSREAGWRRDRFWAQAPFF